MDHASSEQKVYEQATNAYAMASMLDPKNVWPHIWAGGVFEKQKDIERAKMAFASALDLAKADPSCDKRLVQSLQEKVQIMNRK